MKRILFHFGILLLYCISSYAQSVDQIKADRQTYLWGEGKGSTVNRADKEALSALISQISTNVQSEFTLLKKELDTNGQNDKFIETYQSIVKTYSRATLDNTERLVISNEPDACVFRFIKRTEVAKVFNERKEKILGYTHNAVVATEKRQIADALRYYYWALTLLKSHPNGDEVKLIDNEGKTQLLSTWIPLQINSMFANLEISVNGVDKNVNCAIYTLKILYKNQPIENFDYSFWDGTDWSNLYAAKNGMGQIELYGIAAESESVKLKAEYIFEGESRSDPVTQNLLLQLEPVPFRHSYYNLNLKEKEKPDYSNTGNQTVRETVPLTQVQNKYPYEQKVAIILQAIKTKNYEHAKDVFTPEGFEVFNRLIKYGNARVIGENKMKYIIFDNKVICRSIPMMFNFETNQKQFVEEVVFHFTPEEKVESITFALSETALDDILQKEIWKEKDRIILVNFLEHYKTAYALKQLDYIERIFADDALIITGTVVKVKSDVENKFQHNEIVKYNRQSKDQYIRNLRHSFQAKEYVNIKFENSQIKKAGKGGDVYGVQIKQNYFSSNYGDVGYLFLMVDLNNPDEPIIHVRTWQPETGKNDSIYGLSSFN